jgi:hypothetical protein
LSHEIAKSVERDGRIAKDRTNFVAASPIGRRRPRLGEIRLRFPVAYAATFQKSASGPLRQI